MVVNASDVPVLNFPVERECVCSTAGCETPRCCLCGICRTRHLGPTILDFIASGRTSIIDSMPTSSSRQTPSSLAFSAISSSIGARWASKNAAQHTGVVKTRITPPPYRRDGSQSSSPSTRCGPVSNGMLSRPLKLKHVSVAFLVDFSVVDAVDETEVWRISMRVDRWVSPPPPPDSGPQSFVLVGEVQDGGKYCTIHRFLHDLPRMLRRESASVAALRMAGRSGSAAGPLATRSMQIRGALGDFVASPIT